MRTFMRIRIASAGLQITARTASGPCRAVAVLICLIVAAAASANAVQDAQIGAQAVKPAAPPTMDGILKVLATYDGGVESVAVWWLRDYVYARKDDPAGRAECEAKLLQFLGTETSPPGQAAASRYLRVIAGDTAVPKLAKLLEHPRSVDHALYVLQQIPGTLAEQALVRALGATTGPAKTAVIAALGERRSPTAVPVLVPLLQQEAFAPAAAVALGRIGGDASVAPLLAAFGTATGARKTTIAGALMEAAPGFELRQERASIYDRLASDAALPETQRRAALAGLILAAADVRQAVIDMLSRPDALAREAALAHASLAFFPDTIGQVCARLPTLPESEQIVLMAALSTYTGDGIVPSFLEAARGPSQTVRLAAWKALGARGDASVVPVLADAAAAARGGEQAAIRFALASLKGRAVDDAIVALLQKEPPDAILGELLLAAGERRIFLAKPLVTDALASSSGAVRTQALRALQTIGTPSDVNAVLDVLLTAEVDTERAEAEKTAADLARKAVSADGRSRAVRTRLAAEQDAEARVRLIGLFPLMGDPGSLPLLRTALADPDSAMVDAAVRALVAWPTTDARDDVIGLARGPGSETHRLLALAGLVRLTRLDRYRNPQAAVADLRLAAELSWRPEEQKLVLSALAQFPCREALDLVTGFLREDATRAEAQAAIDTIRERWPKEAIRQ